MPSFLKGTNIMFLELLTFPVSAPLGGIIWLGEQLLERANAELDDAQNLQKQLLALQLAFDIGEISEEEFEIQEEELLLKIQALEEAAEESGWKVQTPSTTPGAEIKLPFKIHEKLITGLLIKEFATKRGTV